MDEGERAVLRFLDGRMLKGFLTGFSEQADEINLRDPESGKVSRVKTDELKAVFFVRTFEGDRKYDEKKCYGIRKPRGHRTFVKFRDGEDIIGFLEGAVPWEKGFFLDHHSMKGLKGFYLLPADDHSNNVRIFVFAAAVRDATVVP